MIKTGCVISIFLLLSMSVQPSCMEKSTPEEFELNPDATPETNFYSVLTRLLECENVHFSVAHEYHHCFGFNCNDYTITQIGDSIEIRRHYYDGNGNHENFKDEYFKQLYFKADIIREYRALKSQKTHGPLQLAGHSSSAVIYFKNDSLEFDLLQISSAFRP